MLSKCVWIIDRRFYYILFEVIIKNLIGPGLDSNILRADAKFVIAYRSRSRSMKNNVAGLSCCIISIK